MTQDEREKIAHKGSYENDIVGFFASMEKKMEHFEQLEHDHDNTVQATKAFSSLASSNAGKKGVASMESSGKSQPDDGASKAEHLKNIRKKHGAQSKEYKEALIQI